MKSNPWARSLAVRAFPPRWAGRAGNGPNRCRIICSRFLPGARENKGTRYQNGYRGTRIDVMKLVLSQSLKLGLIGSGIGFALTFLVARLMTSMVYAIHPKDPATFLGVAVFVAGISVLAAYVPARRAAGIEPLSALREE